MLYRIAKRGLDIVGASLAILVFLPFGLVIALVLRLTGEGEIFYRQTRFGHRRQQFGLYKFVTMRKDSPKSGTITLKNDPRVLPVGRFLRKAKLNEVPQMLNVLLGDMSLVGWRPLPQEVFDFYPPELQEKLARLRPGLTGIGSIVFRDEESLLADVLPEEVQSAYRVRISPYKGALERWYVDHAGLWLDVKLILLTAWVVLFPQSRLHERLLPSLPPRPPNPEGVGGDNPHDAPSEESPSSSSR